MGSSIGYSVDSCSSMVSTSCRGTSALASGAASPPPFLTMVSAVLFLTRFFPHLSFSQLLCRVLPFLKYLIAEMLPASLTGSALPSGGSVLEPTGTGSVRHGGSFWHLFIADTPAAPPATKTLLREPNRLVQERMPFGIPSCSTQPQTK